MKQGFTYILASDKNGTLYIGVTSDLAKRVYEHQNGMTKGFTKKYKVNRLVYYETFEDITAAIEREKELKRLNRDWKIQLIEENNPDWADLSKGVIC